MANNKQELVNMLVKSGMPAKDIAEVLKGLGYGAPEKNTSRGRKTDAPKKEKTEEWTKKDGTTIMVTEGEKEYLQARKDYLENKSERTQEQKDAERAEFDRQWSIWQANGQKATKKGTEARKKANSAETARIWAEIRKNRK